jgi:hypothetical protein
MSKQHQLIDVEISAVVCPASLRRPDSGETSWARLNDASCGDGERTFAA